MEPCSQEARIERLETATERIGEQVTQIAADVNTIKVRIEPFMGMVQEHDRVLEGSNGDVGLVAKVTSATSVMEDIAVALRGKGEDPGLIADIRDLMEWMGEWKDERKWLARLIVGIVVAEVLGLTFVLLK